jgi:hypothetical protein
MPVAQRFLPFAVSGSGVRLCEGIASAAAAATTATAAAGNPIFLFSQTTFFFRLT